LVYQRVMEERLCLSQIRSCWSIVAGVSVRSVVNVRTGSMFHIIVDEYCYVMLCNAHSIGVLSSLKIDGKTNVYYRVWFSYVFTYLGTHMSSIVFGVSRVLKLNTNRKFLLIKPLWKRRNEKRSWFWAEEYWHYESRSIVLGIIRGLSNFGQINQK